MSAALVPTFSKTLAIEGRERAWQLGNAVLNALVVVTGVIVVLAIVFAEPLVQLLAGGFAAVPGKFELTVLLTRVVSPFLLLVAVAAACMGMLNSLNVFFVPALSPAMFNVASIVAVVALVPVAQRRRLRPDPRRCGRRAGRRSRAGDAAVAGAARAGLPVSPAPRLPATRG